jgi:hypothetical protein
MVESIGDFLLVLTIYQMTLVIWYSSKGSWVEHSFPPSSLAILSGAVYPDSHYTTLLLLSKRHLFQLELRTKKMLDAGRDICPYMTLYTTSSHKQRCNEAQVHFHILVNRSPYVTVRFSGHDQNTS